MPREQEFAWLHWYDTPDRFPTPDELGWVESDEGDIMNPADAKASTDDFD
jgi:hypothetical protein